MIMMSSEKELTDEQLTSVTGGTGYEQNGDWVINGQDVNISQEDIAALTAKDPSQLNSYEKAVLEQAKKKGLI